mmetsp:Transcript_29544/g.60518  ORF Transcript_29544/g.60518 Transcript_29544/m.60518 type:complete len:200 (+) Transcript_29544:650-1249(+)
MRVAGQARRLELDPRGDFTLALEQRHRLLRRLLHEEEALVRRPNGHLIRLVTDEKLHRPIRPLHETRIAFPYRVLIDVPHHFSKFVSLVPPQGEVSMKSLAVFRLGERLWRKLLLPEPEHVRQASHVHAGRPSRPRKIWNGECVVIRRWPGFVRSARHCRRSHGVRRCRCCRAAAFRIGVRPQTEVIALGGSSAGQRAR